MDKFKPYLDNLVGFLKFLSTTYGTGNFLFDLLIAGTVLLCLIVFLGILRAMSYSRDRDLTEFEDIQSTVDNLQIQLSELRSGVIGELEKWRGELGYLKQELRGVISKKETLNSDLEVESTRKTQDKNDLTSLFKR